MKSAFTKVRLLFQKISSKNEDPKPLEFPEIGWKITMPEKFRQLNDGEVADFINSGQGILVKPVLETGEELVAKILFIAQFGHVNSFTGLIIPVTGDAPATYVARIKEATAKKIERLYKAEYEKKPGVTVKTVHDCIMIGKIEFESVDIIVSTTERILYQGSSYFKIHSGHYINISAAFKEDSVGREMFHALLESKFKEDNSKEIPAR